ncbi:MAG: DUF2974 domain-containing protein, partial [Eubacteriales bacterium]|nr:DUF2974 domain-containing protein [Eubacteriales bacterium]
GEAETISDLPMCAEGQSIAQGITAVDDEKLFPLVSASRRFGGAIACEYVHEQNEISEKQFAAITFVLPDDSVFISFRGTDSTLLGWKEDFNLAFTSPIPSQLHAQQYLQEIANHYGGLLRIGGHSKGGNLAMYAAATVDEGIQSTILDVFNNDGPGLSDTVACSEGYERIKPRLSSFVPQASVVGMLLIHPETFTVVNSNSVSVFQHNPYTWQVEGAKFVREKELRRGSVYLEKVLKRWLTDIDEQQRKCFVDTLFRVLSSTDAKSFGKDFWYQTLRNPGAMLGAVQDIDKETFNSLCASMAALVTAALDAEPSKTNGAPISARLEPQTTKIIRKLEE